MKMRKIILLLFSLTLLSAQTSDQKPETDTKQNPCNSALVIKAQLHGLRSLKWVEIPLYYRDVYLCKRSGQTLRQHGYIENAQLEEDHKKTNYPKGWTSTFIYLLSVGLITYSIQLTVTNM